MSKAEKAIRSAPGVLAVKVDYKQKQATIGTKVGSEVKIDAVFEALDHIGYRGTISATPEH